jgi:alpha-galactosidase
VQGHKLRDDGQREVWTKPMSNGDVAVVLLNRDTATVTLGVAMSELGLAGGRHRVRDLWAHADRQVDGVLEATLRGHSAAMYVVRK